MILDSKGDPIDMTDARDPGLSGGWRVSGGVADPVTSIPTFARGTFDRATTQRAARLAYHLNPLFYGAVQVVHSFTLGAGINYGEFADKRAQAGLEELWATNDLDELTDRWLIEHLLDGESLTLWPLAKIGDVPARLGFWDVVDGGLDTVETEPGVPHHVTRIKANHCWYEDGQFVWRATDALYNDPRGWPATARAIGPALAYMNFLDARRKIHELAGRINAIYYAFAKDDAELNRKGARFRNVPRSGAVLTLGQNAEGKKESFEFHTPDLKSQDAAVDGKLIKQLLAVALGLPEHYLAEGGGVTRTTADSMGAPTRRGFQKRQRQVFRWLNAVMITELVRRNGPDQLYKVVSARVLPGGDISRSSRKVRAYLMETPVIFPTLNDEDLEGLIKKVEVAARLRLASRATLSGELGYDHLAEVERQQQEPDPTPAPAPTGG